jgi:hypothetical protein
MWRFAIGVCMGLCLAKAQAALPATLNYQGRVKLNAGGVVPDSTGNTFVFRICADSACATPLWTETWNSTTSCVTTTAGLFNVVLGTFSPLNLPFNAPYYIEVNVNADGPMVPRQPLTSAPYAFTAGSVVGPISVTTTTATAIFSDSSSGLAGSYLGLTGLAAQGSTLGLSATASSAQGQAIIASVTSSNPAVQITNNGAGPPLRLNAMNFPSNDGGQAGTVLKTDGAGNLSFGIATTVAAPLDLTTSAGVSTIAAFNNSASGGTTGVFATSIFGAGVVATGGAFGVSATSASPNGSGGIFQGLTGVVAIGTSAGVSASTTSLSSPAIYGLLANSSANGDAAIFGDASAGSGGNYGLYGLANIAAGTGVYGSGLTGVAGVAANNSPGYGLSGSINSTNGLGVLARNPGGSALEALGFSNGVSASASGPSGTAVFALGNTGVAAYSSFLPIYALNTAGGGFIPAILGQAGGTNVGIVGTNLSGGMGSLGGSLIQGTYMSGTGVQGIGANMAAVGVLGEGGTGVEGKTTYTAGTGVYALATLPATKALEVQGNAQFDGLGNTTTFNMYVSFSAGTNLAFPFPVPLSMVAAVPFGSSVLSVSQSSSTNGGLAIYGYTPASATAAIFGDSMDPTVPNSNGTASAGVVGKGSIGVVGLNRFPYSYGVIGSIDATGNTNSIAVFGTDNGTGIGGSFNGLTGVVAQGNPAGGIGVYTQALGTNGVAVLASGNAAGLSASASSATAYGVFASVNSSNAAIFGNNPNVSGVAVYGIGSNSVGGTAIYGVGDTALQATGVTYGVSATASGTAAYGLYASVNSTNSAVYGKNSNVSGFAVYGVGSNSAGGTAIYGVADTALQATGVTYGISSTASSGTGYGVWASVNSSNSALYGKNSSVSGFAVYGVGSNSAGGTAIYGVADTALQATGVTYGISSTASSGTGYGVWSSVNSSNSAVYGINTNVNGFAVYGVGSNTAGGTAIYGVADTALQATGVTFGISSTASGASGEALYAAVNSNNAAVYALNNGAGSGIEGDDEGASAGNAVYGLKGAAGTGGSAVFGHALSAAGTGLAGTNTLATASSGGFALHVNGLIGIQNNNLNDSNSSSTGVTFNAPAGTLTFTNGHASMASYTITDNFVTGNSTIMVTIVGDMAGNPAFGARIPIAGGNFTINFNPAVTFNTNGGINFIIMNQ